MSVDSFWMVLDKTSALEEMARVIQPSGRFVMTTWVSPYLSVESMLNAAGFDLLTYEETPGWKERQMAVYSSILKNRNELAKAIGDSATEVLIAEAEQTPAQLSSSPRCFIAAQRKAQA
jgi:ubiquinone/menaquinone biosynthesis C-methylase UbiE